MVKNKNIQIKLKKEILIVNFKGKFDLMNSLLDPISNKYEGIVSNRIGHNFPSDYIPYNHFLFEYKSVCKYVVGIANQKDLAHELAHAKFYLDSDYKNKIINEWNGLDKNTQTYLYNFLKKLGYSDKVIIDEYQAYRYTESDNFFGIKLN
jgi:hypothetical protein